MYSFNDPNNSQESYTGIPINQHVTVQAASGVTGYNIQYLQRKLRSGALEGVKIGQMWLIEMESLESYPQHVETTIDRRYGPR